MVYSNIDWYYRLYTLVCPLRLLDLAVQEEARKEKDGKEWKLYEYVIMSSFYLMSFAD